MGFTSVEGGGTAFFFAVPLRLAPAESDRAPLLPPPPPLRVAVLVERPSLQQTLVNILGTSGAEIALPAASLRWRDGASSDVPTSAASPSASPRRWASFSRSRMRSGSIPLTLPANSHHAVKGVTAPFRRASSSHLFLQPAARSAINVASFLQGLDPTALIASLAATVDSAPGALVVLEAESVLALLQAGMQLPPPGSCGCCVLGSTRQLAAVRAAAPALSPGCVRKPVQAAQLLARLRMLSVGTAQKPAPVPGSAVLAIPTALLSLPVGVATASREPAPTAGAAAGCASTAVPVDVASATASAAAAARQLCAALDAATAAAATSPPAAGSAAASSAAAAAAAAIAAALPLLLSLSLPTTQSASHPASPSRAVPPPPEHRLRVLVVDDIAMNLKIVTAILARCGGQMDVEVATNGREAFEAVAAASPAFDCVFMDIQMPECDGYEATRLIRQWESAGRAQWADLHPTDCADCLPDRAPAPGAAPARRTWIVALSALADEKDRADALSAGMDSFLTKPLTTDAMRAAVKCAREAAVPPSGRQVPAAPLLAA